MLEDLFELGLDLLADLAEHFLGGGRKIRRRKRRGPAPKRPGPKGAGRREEDPWERREEKPPWEK